MNGKPVFTVPTKSIINFDSGFGKKLLCDSMTFTTGQACVYSCAFCYVDSMQKKAQGHFEKHGVVYPPEGHAGVVIRNTDPIEIARRQIIAKPEAFRMAKKVIYASPKVDVAGNMELVKETVEMCKLILELTNWQIRLLSKSNLLPKIAQGLLDGKITTDTSSITRIIYGVSTGTLDDRLAAAFEEGCPLVKKRIESLHWLQDNGFRTFGMICPSLPQKDYVNFSCAMYDAIRGNRCEHVWAEVINVRGDSFTKTMAKLREHGYDWEADQLKLVSEDKAAWENYARSTYLSHDRVFHPEKLRFLQYTTNDTRAWWTKRGVVDLNA